MKKSALVLSLLLAALLPAQAQLGNFGDVPVEIDAENVTSANGLAVATDNVVIHYNDTTIYCDYAEYSPDTHDVVLRGNVRVFRQGQTFTAERALYNFETKLFRGADFDGDFFPFRFSGESISSMGSDAYIVKNGVFTTSDSSKPDYQLRAKQVRIYNKDRIIFSRVTLYVGETPIFWWPYLGQSLNKKQAFTFVPGYLSSWGAFVLTQYTFPISNTEDIQGTFHFDLRSERGAAAGFDVDSKFGADKASYLDFHSYLAKDSSANMDKSGQGRQNDATDRYRVSLKGKLYYGTDNDIYATVNLNKISDSRYLEDFERQAFRVDPTPDNVLALTKRADTFTIDLIARKNLNNFYDTTERLPELAADTAIAPLGKTGLFYQGSGSVARLKRNFAESSALPDYSTTRVDTYHQLIYPKEFGGWLSFVPHLGLRGTYYTDSGSFENETQIITLDSLVPGLAPTTETQTTTVLNKGGSVFRPAFDLGFESSFKFSQTWDLVQNRAFGLDGLRHVVQPYTNFSYVNAGHDASDILQFDRLNPSTQPFELNFPEFNSVDAISDWTILRLGVYNRLQTRRDNQTINWLELNSFFNVNIDKPDFPNGVFNEGTLSNFYNNLRWSPVPWAALQIQSQIPLDSQGFAEVNTNVNFLATQNLRLTVGHRYISNNQYFQDSSQAVVGAYYRVNDNWGLSIRENYEFATSTLQEQRYQVYRDLSSWVASFGVVVQNNQGSGNGRSTEYGLLLTFTLKDFPQVTLPLSVNPSDE